MESSALTAYLQWVWHMVLFGAGLIGAIHAMIRVITFPRFWRVPAGVACAYLVTASYLVMASVAESPGSHTLFPLELLRAYAPVFPFMLAVEGAYWVLRHRGRPLVQDPNG